MNIENKHEHLSWKYHFNLLSVEDAFDGQCLVPDACLLRGRMPRHLWLVVNFSACESNRLLMIKPCDVFRNISNSRHSAIE